LFCNFQVYSKVIPLYKYPILFQILFPFRLLQNIEPSFLCYTVGTCWLSILKYSNMYMSIFHSIKVISNELALCMRWPKYWSFNISPSNEWSRLISFRIDWLDLLAFQGISKSLLQFKSINSLALSFLYGLTLTSIQVK